MTSKIKSVNLIYIKHIFPLLGTEFGEYRSYFIKSILEGSFTFRIIEEQSMSKLYSEIWAMSSRYMLLQIRDIRAPRIQGEAQMCGLSTQAEGTLFYIFPVYTCSSNPSCYNPFEGCGEGRLIQRDAPTSSCNHSFRRSATIIAPAFRAFSAVYT